MSFYAATDPKCSASAGSIELIIEAKEKDLGEFSVRRVLPSGQRRMVGPFIFFDHMGPAQFPPGKGIQVRPHPHIGIATVTYLFTGEIMHRDSLGYVQPIRSGAVNLMTAGRGIVHSERAGDDLNTTSTLHGIQSWLALPDGEEESAPGFMHYPADTVPELEVDGVRVRVIMGEAYTHCSPVQTYSPTLYLECRLPVGTELKLPDSYAELAVYVVAGDIQIDQHSYASGGMAVACPDKLVRLGANQDSHVMVIGGGPIGERHIWWNFVSSSKQRIDQAKRDWLEQRFASIAGETEFIPLPQN